MNEDARPAASDAWLAAQLFLIDPIGLRGMVLRGAGDARDALLAAIAAHMPLRRLPFAVDEQRLFGGVDLAASLVAGTTVAERGLIAAARGGALIVPLAERIDPGIAGRLAQALDEDPALGLILLDDGSTADETPPACLLERVAFRCDLSQTIVPAAGTNVDPLSVAGPDDMQLAKLGELSLALGVDSARALRFAVAAARAHAAFERRGAVDEADIAVAARLVFAPRATQLPGEAPPDEAPDSHTAENAPDDPTAALDSGADIVLAAAVAAIPPDVLAGIAAGRIGRRAAGSGAGARRRSLARGRPLAARPGVPRGGARLALIDTLRAAAPWQALRRGEDRAARIVVRKDDLRIRRFAERAALVSVFCVDASGSAALARLGEAKGAIELLLAQAYVRRAEVALVAFRKDGAEQLLPPTRSLTRARRLLGELPGGGGTPLAAGIELARQVGESAAARGRTPFLVVLTDGRANVARSPDGGRAAARVEALNAARQVNADAVVIDISPAPRPEAAELAQAMRARYLALPRADAAALSHAVAAAQPAAA